MLPMVLVLQPIGSSEWRQFWLLPVRWGIEHSSNKAVSAILRGRRLYLTRMSCFRLREGELEHESVEIIVRRWIENRGRILVGEPVLEEVAYHAFIAQKDFEQVRHFLPGTPATRLHAIDNVFVRSFSEYMERREAKLVNGPRLLISTKGGRQEIGMRSIAYSIPNTTFRNFLGFRRLYGSPRTMCAHT